MSEKEMVSVGCKVPNGLRLHVMKRLHEKGTVVPEGTKLFDDMGFIDLPPLHSRSGLPQKSESFVDADKEMVDIWMAENAESSLVTSGMVFVSKPEEPKAAEPTPEPEHHTDIDDAELERRTRPDGEGQHEEPIV